MGRIIPILEPKYDIPFDTVESFEKACLKFADKITPKRKNRIAKRGQHDELKINQDFYIGALTEHVVVWALNEEGLDYSMPDLTIYKKRSDEKGHGPDTVSRANRYVPLQIKNITKSRDSWIIEKTALLDDKVWFLFVDFDDIDSILKIPYQKPIQLRKFQHLLKGPKLERLRDAKVAIYKEDLDNLMKKKVGFW